MEPLFVCVLVCVSAFETWQCYVEIRIQLENVFDHQRFLRFLHLALLVDFVLCFFLMIIIENRFWL